MSFFDDDEPGTTRVRPQRSPAAEGGPGSDPQQLLVRRLVAAGVGLVLILLLVFGVKGCLDGRKDQALKDYDSDVASIIGEASVITSEFFDILTTSDTSPVEVESQISQSRLRAESQADQAKNLSVPGEMKPAQRSLLLSLGLLEETMGKIANKIISALSNDSATAEPAVLSITAEMQAFLAANVLFNRRTQALIDQVLEDNEISGQEIEDPGFLPNTGWLDAPTVAERINAGAASGAGANSDSAKASSGTHGHGLVSVSAGDTALDASASNNRIPAASDLAFNVKIANQGENDETNVVVVVTITPVSGGDAVTQQESVDMTAAGSETTVQVPLRKAPPLETATKVKVEVREVPGEKTTDNNSVEFPAIFER